MPGKKPLNNMLSNADRDQMKTSDRVKMLVKTK